MTTDLNFTSTWAVDIKEYELNWAGKLVEAKHFNNEQEASTFLKSFNEKQSKYNNLDKYKLALGPYIIK